MSPTVPLTTNYPIATGERSPAALSGLLLATLLSSLGTSIANVALPSLAEDFAATFGRVQWVVLAYLLAITTLIVAAGRLGDAIGQRRVLLAGLGIFTVGSALCGLAPTLGWLIAARAIQGVGAAAMMALSLSLLTMASPADRTGRIMGLAGTMSALGTALGPSLGGLLLATTGWRMVFLAPVPVGILAWILVHRNLAPGRTPAAPTGRGRIDGVGTILLAAALACYALAFTGSRDHFGLTQAGLLALAVLAAAALLVVEPTVDAPLIRVDLFRRRQLRTGLLAAALVASVLMATLVVGPFHLSRALGLDTIRVGLVLMAGPVVAALTGIPAGRLVDRWGTLRTARLGLLGVLGGTLAFATMPLAYGLTGYIAALALTTAGYALFQAANNSAVMTEGRTEERGVVSGLLNLARNLGLISGASGLGTVFSLAAGSADISRAAPAAVAIGTRATFAVAAALTVIALAVTHRAEISGRGRP